jgi:hypothetical protein
MLLSPVVKKIAVCMAALPGISTGDIHINLRRERIKK